MMGNFVLPKYTDLGIPLVNVTMNGTIIKSNLIELGVVINVMTKQFTDDLMLDGLRPITTILQLANR